MHRRYQGRMRHHRGNLFWGVALITAGSLFLLDRYGVVPLREAWRIWPAVLAVFGLGRIVFAHGVRDVLRGLSMIAIAGWLYACIERLWGWTFETTWPIILIVLGVKAVIGGLVGFKRQQEKESAQ